MFHNVQFSLPINVFYLPVSKYYLKRKIDGDVYVALWWKLQSKIKRFLIGSKFIDDVIIIILLNLLILQLIGLNWTLIKCRFPYTRRAPGCFAIVETKL